MKDNRRPFVFCMLALLLIAVACSSESLIEKKVNDIKRLPEVEVDAHTLYALYNENEVKADNFYKNRILIVSGTVEDIRKDLLDTMYVTLSVSSDVSIFCVQCMFSNKHNTELANLEKGMRVQVKGLCEGKFGNVLLRGCQFYQDEPLVEPIPE